MSKPQNATVEMPKGWNGEPVIKFPVHYRNGFVIDADEQIVCNLLWNSHRKNYDVRDQAGQYVASSLNTRHESQPTAQSLRRATERALHLLRQEETGCNGFECGYCQAVTELTEALAETASEEEER